MSLPVVVLRVVVTVWHSVVVSHSDGPPVVGDDEGATDHDHDAGYQRL